jgi:peroxiredoxin
MKKTKFILAATCCLPLSLLAQKGFTIKGKIGMLNAPAMVYLQYKNDTTIVKDSAILHNGEFTFKGKVSSPGDADLALRHDTVAQPKYGWYDNLHFYIENANITVTAQDSIWRAVVKGSVTNDEEKLLHAMQRPYKASADSLVAVYNKLTPEQRKDSVWRTAAGKVMGATSAGYDSVTRAFIAKHLNSYISLLAFKQVELAYNFNPDTAAGRFAKFPATLRASGTGKKLAAIIDKGHRTNTGVTAMDFTVSDTSGNPVKLFDFRGRYVLVDFWASWCKPCRAENPNLLKAYNKFKDKNFTILGVSLDDDNGRRAWLGAVKKDAMPWTQVSELKGFKSQAAVLYGIEAIPSNFLIDPNGKIIGRNLRGEDLDKKLDDLFSMK